MGHQASELTGIQVIDDVKDVDLSTTSVTTASEDVQMNDHLFSDNSNV